MAKFNSPLDNVHVAAPCPADWNEMNGDERARFCNQCQLNVYNLSAMTRQEAEQLLREREGRLCVRFYRRADGTIITENCPKGLAALKRRVTRTATAVFSSVLAFLSGVGIYSVSTARSATIQGEIPISFENLPQVQPNIEERIPTTGVLVVPDVPQQIQGKAVMGLPYSNSYKPVQIKKRR